MKLIVIQIAAITAVIFSGK